MSLDLRYLAGFFDGEGNVGIYSGGGTGRTLRVQITQVVTVDSTTYLEAIQRRWGGSLSLFNKALRRPAWNYQVGGDGAARFLGDLLPHLVFKREQADLALLWFSSRPTLQRHPLNGRRLARAANDIETTELVASVLKRMKWGIDEYADDLASIRRLLVPQATRILLEAS